MSAMTPQGRVACQELLREVTEALRTFGAVDGQVHDENRQRLFRSAMVLRRQLVEDATEPPPPVDGTESSGAAVAVATPNNADELSVQCRRSWRDRIDEWNRTKDFTLDPTAWLLISGLCLLAWIIKLDGTDAAIAISLLMFARFVPIFIAVGSLFGRAGTGAIIGIVLFFGLLCTDSLSLARWDTLFLESRATLMGRATGLADALYLLGIVGLLLSAAATFALRQERRQVFRRSLRMAMQVFIALQMVLIVELGYLSVRHTCNFDRNNAALSGTLKKSNHDSGPQR